MKEIFIIAELTEGTFVPSNNFLAEVPELKRVILEDSFDTFQAKDYIREFLSRNGFSVTDAELTIITTTTLRGGALAQILERTARPIA